MASLFAAAGAANGWSRPEARWIRPQHSQAVTAALAASLGIERLAAAVLVKRGFADDAAARGFLYPALEALHDPTLMRDMDRAAARVREAIAAREPILLYGDYDVDGTTSIVVLKRAIELLGGRAQFHVPHRLNEGYGMRREVSDRAAATPAFVRATWWVMRMRWAWM
jgi:single-stranded-DNA-specific exonuclease